MEGKSFTQLVRFFTFTCTLKMSKYEDNSEFEIFQSPVNCKIDKKCERIHATSPEKTKFEFFQSKCVVFAINKNAKLAEESGSIDNQYLQKFFPH